MQHLVPNPLKDLPDCHIVGGAVRDYLLELPISDVDLATSMAPQQVIATLSSKGFTVIPTGIDHGTVTAIINGQPYEITTFRRDIATDGRRATVYFSSDVKDDLARRDFTINSIAVSTATGALVDPFNGQQDLKNGVIRAVGTPEQRFNEDYLRIIRAARFASRYNFTIDAQTDAAMHSLADRILDVVSIERIVAEIDKSFNDINCSFFLLKLHSLEVLQQLLPELKDLPATFRAVDEIQPSHRWYALLHTVDAELIPNIAERLKLPNWLRNSVYVITCYYNDALTSSLTDADIRRLQSNVDPYIDDLKILCEVLAKEPLNDKVFDRDPTIDAALLGRDLIDAGYTPSKLFGAMLARAYAYQIQTGVTDKDELLRVAIGC